jgi:hypothetical protein
LSAAVSELFDGAGFGPTADYAVQAAKWDAEITASYYGLYTCQIVGEPTVYSQPRNSLRAFRAHVMVNCE